MVTLGRDIKEFLENEKDIEFEEEISRNPYRLKSWWRYLLAKEGAKPKTRNIIHERALKFLPNRFVRVSSKLRGVMRGGFIYVPPVCGRGR